MLLSKKFKTYTWFKYLCQKASFSITNGSLSNLPFVTGKCWGEGGSCSEFEAIIKLPFPEYRSMRPRNEIDRKIK